MNYPLYYRVIKRLGYECYYWWREIVTAFMSGMEDAGYQVKGE